MQKKRRYNNCHGENKKIRQTILIIPKTKMHNKECPISTRHTLVKLTDGGQQGELLTVTHTCKHV